MKIGLFALIALNLWLPITNAQVEPEKYKSVVNEFKNNYNSDQFESIFNMFAPDMQKALPLEKTKVFFSGLYAEAGKIQECKFSNLDQGGTASYETKFDKGVFLINVTLNEDSKINGFYIKPFQAKPAISNTRNSSKLSLPFKEEWTVIWGGDTKELNYHVEHIAQKNAFDMVITDQEGKSFKNDGRKNEDYYAFGKELIAPCAGKVVLVVDGIKDNPPGELNPIYIPGNTVVIKSGENEFLFFAHFKKHSIRVKEGQTIKKGELLGLCGNSGNSSEPHLHFHIQNEENMTNAIGIKCYFDDLIVNGKTMKDYSPIQKDKIKLK
jgi:murein DD-endopeptidase MepM/ murein hydrolase activator NlpD